MKRLFYKLLIKWRDTMGGRTYEQQIDAYSDGILSDVLNSDLTIRQQTDVLFAAIRKLSNHRQSQIEETQQKLTILQEDMAKLNK